jgi:ribosome-associated protein YbcJ (S4-like RNA binding protein)
MRIEIKTLLKELPKTSHGQALKEYLDECYKEINNTIEEAKGKQLAMKTLKKIFAFYNDGTPVDKIPNQYE